MVEAEKVHHRCLEVVHVDFVFSDAEAELVGAAVVESGLHAAAGHEEGVAVGVVVAAQHGAGGGAAFAEGGAAKFAAPDDESVVQQAALLEVFDEGGDGLVGGSHLGGEAGGDAAALAGAVEVPAPVEEVHKAHAFFHQAAGEQAVVGEAGFAGLGTVGLDHMFRLLRDVHDLGHAGLHAEGQLVLGDAGDGFRMTKLGDLLLIEILQGIEGLAAHGAVHAGGVAHEEDGVAFATALHTLVHAGDEAAAPAALAAAGLGAAGDEGDEAGQILIFRAEAIGGPGTHGGAALTRVAGEEEQLRRGVIELVRVHGADHADLVGDGVEVGAGVAHPHAGLAIAGKGARGTHELGDAGREGKAAAFENGVGAVLAAAFDQLGLVVKEVQVGRRTGHVEVDDALGLGRKVRLFGREWIVRHHTGPSLLLHGMHGDGPQTELARMAEELAAGFELERVVEDGGHCGGMCFDITNCDIKDCGVFRDENLSACVGVWVAEREGA